MNPVSRLLMIVSLFFILPRPAKQPHGHLSYNQDFQYGAVHRACLCRDVTSDCNILRAQMMYCSRCSAPGHHTWIPFFLHIEATVPPLIAAFLWSSNVAWAQEVSILSDEAKIECRDIESRKNQECNDFQALYRSKMIKIEHSATHLMNDAMPGFVTLTYHHRPLVICGCPVQWIMWSRLLYVPSEVFCFDRLSCSNKQCITSVSLRA